jgi:hypothetical protein
LDFIHLKDFFLQKFPSTFTGQFEEIMKWFVKTFVIALLGLQMVFALPISKELREIVEDLSAELAKKDENMPMEMDKVMEEDRPDLKKKEAVADEVDNLPREFLETNLGEKVEKRRKRKKMPKGKCPKTIMHVCLNSIKASKSKKG